MIDPTKNTTHLFDRITADGGKQATVATLNKYIAQLEGESVEPETYAYETDQYRAIMVNDYNGRVICAVLQPNAHFMNRRFYCWILDSEYTAGRLWATITHWSLECFKRGVITTPKDFTKSMGLLRTLETQ